MNSHLQVSLRELLFLVLFAAIGLASLRAGGVVASIVVMLAIVATMCFAILAFVGRHSIQAFAIGFLLPVIVYVAAILVVGKSELDPYAGKLPTSRLLRPMFRLMVKPTWTDMSTGQVVPDYDPDTDPGGYGAAPMAFSESLDRRTFMSLGHVLFAMMFGYAGAKFAVAVHREQQEIQSRSRERMDAGELH
ncbi:MAG TPA: hypothetical protein VMV10_20315 [Pirellulales bacterium]|nr:hypothetical protein [Pirellulales bacterium]